MGGGGKAPTNVSQTSIPEYARPYVESNLGQTQKLIYNVGDNNQILGMKPMAQYQGLGANQNRVAGFTGMEIGAANRLGNQQTSLGGAELMVPNYGLARDATSSLGQQSVAAGNYKPNMNFQANYNPGLFEQSSVLDPGVIEQYMSPYMQNVVDINKREAIRDQGKQNVVNQAQAVQAGAFGGGRDAMVRAEAQRNLGTRLSDIQNTGTQAAFESGLGQYNTEAARQFAAQQAREQGKQFLTSADQQAQQMREQSRQFGAGLGLQGLNQALQAAGQFGQLTQNEAAQRLQAGQQQFDQQMGITDKLAQFGGIQRAADQQRIDNSYQDYLTAQNFPYKNLAFMSDMLRGLPLSDTSVYQAPPSSMSQIAGLGTAGIAGLGLYNSMR